MIFLIIAGVVIILDQLTKSLVRQILSPGQSIHIINGIFHITYVNNPGSAFGLLPNHHLFLLLVTFITVILIFFYYGRIRPREMLMQVALGMELGGAAGNFIDRTAYGLVTDFLDFRIWPVFNVADSAIVIGLILLVLTLLLEKRQKRASSSE